MTAALTNFEAVMDDGLARAENVMFSQRATQRCGWVQRSSHERAAAPARCPFFCILFFGQAKKSMFQQTKN
ncbi:MAG: hypothetical protein IJG80_02510, partial [Selenomonadaceae bacterium]|nr:hypothetical protein [Selenomonadaceae bacterium]